MLGLWIGLAWAAPSITSHDVSGRRLASLQHADHPADLIVLHAAEQYGVIGPCGCDDYPMGGMNRIERYADRLDRREADAVVLKVYTGGAFLPPSVSADVVVLEGQRHPNEAMAEVLEQGRWDAINLTCGDLHADRSWSLPSGTLSTNLRKEGAEIATHQRVQRRGMEVLVLGVSGPCGRRADREGWRALDPVEAVQASVAAYGASADRVVVLVHRASDRVSAIARVEGVDVVVEADRFIGRYPAIHFPSGALRVRSWEETRRLGELRMDWDDEGELLHVQDGAIGLEPGLRGARWVDRLIDEVAVGGGPG